MGNRFDTEEYIKEVKEMNLFELIAFSSQKVSWLEKIKFTKTSPYKKEDEYAISRYRKFIHEFLFFLNTGVKPQNMDEDDFQRTKIVTEVLVSRGELKNRALNVYN
ncbi:MAG: hypothetical protein WDN09_03910 [bacterium]